jgi:hypothetical protein
LSFIVHDPERPVALLLEVIHFTQADALSAMMTFGQHVVFKVKAIA